MEPLGVVPPVPKIEKRPSALLINVYCNVYSHGYQMFNLFSSHYHSNNDFEPNIAQEIRLLMPCFPCIQKTNIRQRPRI